MTAAFASASAEPRRDERRWVLLCTIGLSAFVVGLDNTILNIALSAIKTDLDMSLTGLQWVGTSYILAFSALLIAGGRLTDLFGRRRALVAGLVIFLVTSLAAGLAPTGELLIAIRAIQGLGGALVLPSTLAIIGTDLEGEDRHLGVGIWTACIASAIALGPIVGGAIVSVAHWGFVFFINLPICLLCIVLARRTVPQQRFKLPDRPELIKQLDVPGLLTASVSMMAITFYLVHGQDYGFLSAFGLISLVTGIVFGAAFLWTERRTEYPLVDLVLFRNRIFSGGTVTQILWGLGINGILFFTSLFLQDQVGLDPLEAGLMYVPLAVSIAVMVPVGAKLATHLGVNHTVGIGMVLIAIGMWNGTLVQPDDPLWRFLVGLVLVGLGSGLTTPMTSAVMEVIPTTHAGAGAAVVSTAREISGIVGIVGIGAVLVVRRADALDTGASADAAFMAGFHLALWAATAVIAIGALIAWFTLPTRAEAHELAAAKAAEEAAAAAEGREVDEVDELVEATTPGDFAVAIAEAEAAVHGEHSHGEHSRPR
ncbi:MAG: MFS transporter [Solirubrobacteraceae bacterium]|nr:MFS transporter [Solirubrobacteraceae bacterium]